MNKDSSVVDDVIIKDNGHESDFSKVVKILLDDNYKRRKTILRDTAQVTKINTLDVISQIYDIQFLKRWINGFAEWRTSGDGGKGRQDIVDISKFHYVENKARDQEIFNVLRGRK